MNARDKKVQRIIFGIIRDATLMQVATVNRGKPMVVNVWFSFDEKMDLYFISRYNRIHSRDIADDPNVAGSIVSAKGAVPGRAVMGVTFQGRAREVPKAELRKSYAYYQKRYPVISENHRVEEMMDRTTAMRVYRIVPTKFILFDEVNFAEQPRQELRMR